MMDYKRIASMLKELRDRYDEDDAVDLAARILLKKISCEIECQEAQQRESKEREEQEREWERNVDRLDTILLQYGMPDDTTVEEAVDSLIEDGYIDSQNPNHVREAELAARRVLGRRE